MALFPLVKTAQKTVRKKANSIRELTARPPLLTEEILLCLSGFKSFICSVLTEEKNESNLIPVELISAGDFLCPNGGEANETEVARH